jgi:hypothetical protein
MSSIFYIKYNNLFPEEKVFGFISGMDYIANMNSELNPCGNI